MQTAKKYVCTQRKSICNWCRHSVISVDLELFHRKCWSWTISHTTKEKVVNAKKKQIDWPTVAQRPTNNTSAIYRMKTNQSILNGKDHWAENFDCHSKERKQRAGAGNPALQQVTHGQLTKSFVTRVLQRAERGISQHGTSDFTSTSDGCRLWIYDPAQPVVN